MTLKETTLSLFLTFLLFSCNNSPKVTLSTTKIEKGDISQSVTATGTVESVTQVDVGTQVTGIIDKLYADFNTVVSKGQLIAEIEKTLLESELRSADANMESARVTFEYNKTNYERDKKLHDKQLISDYEFQTSERDYHVSLTSYQKAQADRVRAAKNLNYAEIYSPIDGVVISRDVEVGQTVVSNMNVANLYTIADLDNMQVVGNVDEADIGQVKTGQEVTFTVDAYPESIFKGHVTQVRLNPTTESNVVTYEVIVAAPNPDHKLIPGLTANLTIYVTQEKGIPLVANQAFRFTPNNYPEAKNLPKAVSNEQLPRLESGQKLLWIVSNNKLKPVAVTVGASNGINTQIISGIAPGTEVALEYSVSEILKTPAGEQGDRSPFAPRPPERKKEK